jgi:hypothetical protein
MSMQSWIINLALYLAGTGAALWAYLAFSPMTRDLVAFLSRDAQIAIFRHRHTYWGVSGVCAVLLLARIISALTGADAGAQTGNWIWLAITLVTLAGLAVLYWAMYVPVVMAPPRQHHLVSIDEADSFLRPESTVLGIEMAGEVRAYPRDLIARPHWFNDELGGKPLMISYCILCNSGQAFVPVLEDGRRLELRNMTAFDNNTIYYCVKTGNFIQQLDARVIRGPNEGERLQSYPVIMAGWKEWKRLHPDTRVYYAPPITLRDRTVQKLLMTMIPLSRLAARDKPWHVVRRAIDGRLPAMAFVFGVEIGGDACAYPAKALESNPVVNDTVGGTPIVILFDRQHNIGEVFLRQVADHTLSFEPTSDNGDSLVARDLETGTTWNVSGHALAGPLAGSALSPAPHWNQLFWFSWSTFKPGTRVHQADPA